MSASSPASLTEFLKSLPIPWLFGGPDGQANAGALGHVLDTQVDYVRQAVKAHMPGLAPVDALPHIASERVLIQGPSESNTAFALRLQYAWEQWAWAGTSLGLLCQLYFQGYTDVVIVQQNGLAFSLTGSLPAFTTPGAWDPTPNLVITNLGTNPSITGTPSWWRFDHSKALSEPQADAFCSRFGVIFVSPLPSGWSSAVAPPTPSSTPSLSTINTIRLIIKTWQAAKATCVGIYAVTQGMTIGWPVRKINSGFNAGAHIGPSTVVAFTP